MNNFSQHKRNMTNKGHRPLKQTSWMTREAYFRKHASVSVSVSVLGEGEHSATDHTMTSEHHRLKLMRYQVMSVQALRDLAERGDDKVADLARQELFRRDVPVSVDENVAIHVGVEAINGLSQKLLHQYLSECCGTNTGIVSWAVTEVRKLSLALTLEGMHSVLHRGVLWHVNMQIRPSGVKVALLDVTGRGEDVPDKTPHPTEGIFITAHAVNRLSTKFIDHYLNHNPDNVGLYTWLEGKAKEAYETGLNDNLDVTFEGMRYVFMYCKTTYRMRLNTVVETL